MFLKNCGKKLRVADSAKEDGGDSLELKEARCHLSALIPVVFLSLGQYKLEGDLNNIPVAPDWLLAEMRNLPAPSSNVTLISRIAPLTKFSNRL